MPQQRWRKIRASRRSGFRSGEVLESRLVLAGLTVVVDNTSDSYYNNSLRTAINMIDDSGSTTSPNSIVFQIPTTDPGYNATTGTFTILPTQQLPPILVPLIIDGTSESAYLGQPATVVINGSEVEGPYDGLTLSPGSAGSTIDGLEIVQFNGSGIVVTSTDNTIGGVTAGAGNIIGSNGVAGISLVQPVAGGNFSGNPNMPPPGGSLNLIVGNQIGTDPVGDHLGNPVGILDAVAGNTIGGATVAAGNVIGFNTSAGVSITAQADGGDLLIGNLIGTNLNKDSLSNGAGISDADGGNTIGGMSAGDGNVIGFNRSAGVSLSATSGAGDLILGNSIGTNPGGGDFPDPIGILDTSGNNTIGGTAAGAGNVIGNNAYAEISIAARIGGGDLLLGNLIGTNAGGVNLGDGNGIFDNVGGNTIGGTAFGAGNVIGFSSSAGVSISAQAASGDLLLGNFIGTNAAGMNLGNRVGVSVHDSGNTIGGAGSGAGNLIGLNTLAGIALSGQAATGNVILGNNVGTNTAVDHVGNLVGILDVAGGNTIGGTAPGAGNVIGFNTSAGVSISAQSGRGDLLLGNFVGTNAVGINVANNNGIVICSQYNTVGGMTVPAGNVVGFNDSNGIEFIGAAAARNLVVGNFIGVTAAGSTAMANGIGILESGGNSNTIGGTTTGAGNVISGNLTAGIDLDGSTVTGILIAGNRIGTDSAGVVAITQAGQTDPLDSLQNAGIVMISSGGNTIGGTSPGFRNLISGNYVGVMLATSSSSTGGNLLSGNWIGTDVSGLKPLGNIVGVYINSSAGNQIGGRATGSGNLISGNTSVGVEIYGSGSTGNVIAGNSIGLAANGTQTFSNGAGAFTQGEGIFIQDASHNLIGGTTAGTANTITGNQSAGIFILSQSGPASGNTVEGNVIGLSANGRFVPGNNGYGVLVSNAPNNIVKRSGRASNRFGRNGYENVRYDFGVLPSRGVSIGSGKRQAAAGSDGARHKRASE